MNRVLYELAVTRHPCWPELGRIEKEGDSFERICSMLVKKREHVKGWVEEGNGNSEADHQKVERRR